MHTDYVENPIGDNTVSTVSYVAFPTVYVFIIDLVYM